MMWPDGFGFMAWWMILPTLIFWGGLIFLIVWAVRRFSGGSVSTQRTPLDIARERYARGEITKEQFEQLKRDLS